MRRLFVSTTLIAIIFAGSAAGQNCSFSPAPPSVNFGNYSVFAGSGSQTTSPTFNVDCSSNNVPISITLSRGINSASFNPRTLNNGSGATLNYNLYVDAANSQIWGDGTGGSVAQNFTTGSSHQALSPPLTIYGTLSVGSDVAAGTYSDTITATLFWPGKSTTATFTVTATVLAECTVSAFAINFGTYEPVVANAATPLDSTATINVFCTKGTTGTVTLDNGSNFLSPNRRMTPGGGVFMNYQVYKDSGRTTIWDNSNINSGTSGSKNIALGGGFIAYGRIPAGQDVKAGSYSDTMQSVVNY
jgi:spore coat protein U-like protein